jgi:hypothetical protein
VFENLFAQFPTWNQLNSTILSFFVLICAYTVLETEQNEVGTVFWDTLYYFDHILIILNQ